MKALKKISSKFRPHIGPHNIELSDHINHQGINGIQPIFIFDFFAIEKTVRYSIASYIAEQSNINIRSLDIVWVGGQDQLLKKDILSFWLWDKNGLIPFAFVGKEAHKGPFSVCEGMLFLNTKHHKKNFSKMEVLLFSIKDNKLTKIADCFEDLNIIKNDPDRDVSEAIKQEGNILFGQGEFDKATATYFDAMYKDPTNPNPYNNIGMISQATGKMNDRGDFFTLLSFLVDPSYVNGMRGYTGCLARKGKFKKAIKLIKKCIALEESAQNYSILATFLYDSGQFEKAEVACKNGLALDLEHPELLKIQKKLLTA